jgi:hypothetical protein
MQYFYVSITARWQLIISMYKFHYLILTSKHCFIRTVGAPVLCVYFISSPQNKMAGNDFTILPKLKLGVS